MKMRKISAVSATLAAMLLLSACAGISAPSRFYTLSSLAEVPSPTVSGTASEISVSIARVTFPEWLDRTQIVTRSSRNQIAVAEFERWAGSLADDFTKVLGENLAVLLRTTRIDTQPSERRFDVDYQLHIDVLHFEGSLTEEVSLKARWIVTSGVDRDVVGIHTIAIDEPVDAPDYESLVRAKSSALLALSEEIALRLQEVAAR